MQSFEMVAESDRQILRIYFRGVVTAESLAAQASQNAKLITTMSRGFTVVADLSALEEMDLNCVPHITHLMDLFQSGGVGRVIRLIPDADKDIGFTILSHTHYRGRVPFQTVTNLDELNDAIGDAVATNARAQC